MDEVLGELAELLRIPSISARPEHAGDVVQALEWVASYVRGAGGTAEIHPTAHHPLLDAELPASTPKPGTPAVLVYGHVDVQPPDPLESWDSPPFEPSVRDGWLYARGVADDKGQLYLLLRAAAELARSGSLPVNVRFLCDGEEEIGGPSAAEFLGADPRPPDACIIFDGRMIEPGVPAFVVGTRGALSFKVRLTTSGHALHSGLFGNAALNATHALVTALSALLPRDGRLPEPLRAGIAPPTPEERAVWETLTPGEESLARAGAVPYDDRAADEFYLRTTAEPSLDVNGLQGGNPGVTNTSIPSSAIANFTVRLARGQDPATIADAVERLLRDAAPRGTTLEISLETSVRPSAVAMDAPAVQIGMDVFESTTGRRPLAIRVGGTMPILARLAERGIPTMLTGFALNECNIHSPNERFLVRYLPLGIETSRRLFVELAALR